MFVPLHPMSLQNSLINKSLLLTLQGYLTSTKNGVISLPQDKPCSKHKCVHKEFRVEICPDNLHHRMKGHFKILVDA
jgi:hypothetical protein